MPKAIKKETIHAKGVDIGIYTTDFENEFISLTDIAKYRNVDDPRFVIQNWMRNRNTIEFLAVWETLHNPDFNRVQFEAVKNEAGLNRFVMTPTKWIEQKISQKERLLTLRDTAKRQLETILSLDLKKDLLVIENK